MTRQHFICTAFLSLAVLILTTCFNKARVTGEYELKDAKGTNTLFIYGDSTYKYVSTIGKGGQHQSINMFNGVWKANKDTLFLYASAGQRSDKAIIYKGKICIIQPIEPYTNYCYIKK